MSSFEICKPITDNEKNDSDSIIINEVRCMVCVHAGHHERALTHSTLSEERPEIEKIIKDGHWKLIKELGKTTNCPVLMSTVCTNPECFNGENGKIRFPMYGHSRGYCPCEWPTGWEIDGPKAKYRVTGLYNLPSQYIVKKELKNMNKNHDSNNFSYDEFEEFKNTQEQLEKGIYDLSLKREKGTYDVRDPGFKTLSEYGIKFEMT